MVPYQKIFKSLAQAKIRYLVAGGVAVNLHGIERATADLDLIVHLEEANLLKFIQVMKKLGYLPRVPVPIEDLADEKKRQSWIKEKNMLVFSFFNPKSPMELIDIFIKNPLPFDIIYKNRVEKKLFDTLISVIGIRDLILIKKEAGRPRDLFDLGFLEELMKKKNESKKNKI